MTTTPRTPVLLMALAAISAACTDTQPDAPAATTTAAVATAAPTSTTTTISTTPTSTNAPSSTTISTTTSPTSTSTSIPSDPAVAAVVAAAEESWRLFNEAKLDPTNDAKLQALQAVLTEPVLSGATQIILNYRILGRRSVTSEIVPAGVTIDSGSVRIAADGSFAIVVTCSINSNVLVETASNPDGSDRILDDTVSAVEDIERYVLIEGRWLNSQVESRIKYEGAVSCDIDG